MVTPDEGQLYRLAAEFDGEFIFEGDVGNGGRALFADDVGLGLGVGNELCPKVGDGAIRRRVWLA